MNVSDSFIDLKFIERTLSEGKSGEKRGQQMM